MPFIYCTDCGYKNVFTTRQAKFCAGCGQSLLEEPATKKVSNVRSQPTQANLQNADLPAETIPNINKLEYTVDQASSPVTIGDLINTQKEGGERFERTTKASSRKKKLTREELETESMRECASSINRSTD